MKANASFTDPDNMAKIALGSDNQIISGESESVDNEFVIEKNVRKAIENLEVLTSKVAGKEITES